MLNRNVAFDKRNVFCIQLSTGVLGFLSNIKKNVLNGKNPKNGSMNDQRSGKNGLERKELREHDCLV